MKPSTYVRFGLLGLSLFLLICGIASAAGSGSTASAVTTSSASSSSSSTGTTSYQDSASLVYVYGVDYDPQVFYPGETGTITVHLANSASTAVGLTEPDIIGQNVAVINKNAFETLSYIGPGATMDVSFTVSVDGSDGTYYPLFSIGTKDASSVHYPVKLVVDSTDLRASVCGRPDNFAVGKMDTVNFSVINPRDGPLSNILVTVDGAGNSVSPSESFISSLNASSSAIIPFQVTPSQQESNVTFHVSYDNGDNHHTQDVVLPINLGEDKTGAKPIINDIALTNQGGSYQMTGDVTNAGISDAEAMVVSVGAPLTPVQPYSNYAIGSLASDDFSSFTLTFSGNDLSVVPVVVQWKDAQGNSYSSTTTLDLRNMAAASFSGTRSSGSGSAGSLNGGTTVAAAAGGGAARGGGGNFLFGGRGGGGLSAFYPVIAGGIILVIGIVLYTKRKWVLTKLKKQ
ncbi:MAG TPA: hypothetical protein VLY83_06195 [Methanoregula sp.]|nr:hypothetical protein [Methanoregula sp.]